MCEIRFMNYSKKAGLGPKRGHAVSVKPDGFHWPAHYLEDHGEEQCGYVVIAIPGLAVDHPAILALMALRTNISEEVTRFREWALNLDDWTSADKAWVEDTEKPISTRVNRLQARLIDERE